MLNLTTTGQMPVQKVTSEAKASSSLMSYVVMLFFYRKSIIGLALLMGLTAYGIGKLIPQRYIASAQMYMDPKSLQVFENDLNGNKNLDSVAGMNMVESLMKVMTSQVVLRRVAEENKLDQDEDFFKKETKNLLQNFMASLFPSEKKVSIHSPIATATSELFSRVTVKRAERTYIVDVVVRTNDPEKSANLANAVVQTYLDVQNENRADNSRKTSGFLTSRLDELRDKVRISEDATEAFRLKNDLIGAKGALVSEQQLSDANFQLSSAKARASDAKSRYDQIIRAKKNGDISGISEAIASQVVTSLRTQQGETSRKLSELSLELGVKHPQVLNAKAQMTDLTSMINEELNRIAEATKNDLERAVSTEKSAIESLDKLKALTGTNSQASVQLREMEREVEANRQLYNTFLVRSRETTELEKMDTSNTRIITKATPPFFASFPPRGLLLGAIGFILGGLLGVALAFARSFFGGMKNA